MLELPEVETIRRELEREVTSRRVKSVEVASTKPLSGVSKKAFVDRLEGTKVEGVGRKGLLVTIRLDSGDLVVVDLGSTGQLLRAQNKEAVDKATAVVVGFTQGGQLRLRDAKGGSTVEVVAGDDLPTAHPELEDLGLDPIDEPLSWTSFGQLLFKQNMKLKSFLVDPTVIVGLGDTYADEVLFAAGLRHDRESQSLSTQEIRRMYRALVETLHDAVKYGGTTLEEEGFRNVHGQRGEFGEHLQVVQRDKQPCLRCRGVVSKVRAGGHTTYFCPSCQV